MKEYCPVCNTEHELIIVNKKETYPVRGEEVTIDARVAVCGSCGNEVFSRELDFENLERAYSVYRDKHGIVSPDEIKSLRKKMGFSQREFAKKLGWSPATVNRYENGALPSPAHNAVLKALMQKQGPTNKKEIDGKVDALEPWLKEQLSAEPCMENGFRKFDVEKLFNMMVFFVEGQPLSKTALMKHLWYSDFRCFKETSTSISGALYAALPHGPALHNWEKLLSMAQELGYINIAVDYYGDFEVELVEAGRFFNGSVFLPAEIEIMQEVKKEFYGRTARELSDISHREAAWKNTPRGGIISYEYAFYMQAE